MDPELQNNEEQIKGDISKELSKVTQLWPPSMPSVHLKQAVHSNT